MVNTPLDIRHEAMAEFCRRWQVREIAVFGSVARGEATPASDVDLLVTFHAAARPTLFTLVRMQQDLEAMLGRRVDLAEKSSVEASDNDYRRRCILDGARVLYAA